MSTISATELRSGTVIKFENSIYVVLSMMHITPGNWRAIIQCKMRDIKSGSTIERRFSSSDTFELAFIEQVDMEFLYAEKDNLVFMNQENYEQISIPKNIIGDNILYLKENMVIKANFCEGKIIGIQLPNVVELTVVETEPSLRGATVTNVYKSAKVETGARVLVPSFIEKGEIIKIDTRDGKYISRTSGK